MDGTVKKIAFKFGYLGTKFEGFQRQTGTSLRTVEGEILKVLGKACDLSPAGFDLRSAGRTDRDVSAISNCCTFSCSLGPRDVMNMLNANIHGINFHSYSELEGNLTGDFNPRHATSRRYRYFFPPFYRTSLGRTSRTGISGSHSRVTGAPVSNDSHDAPRAFLEEMTETMKLFEGVHDFSNFARVEEGRSPVRRVMEISGGIVEGSIPGNEVAYIDVIGESFLWNQIRRMLGAAVSVSAGRSKREDVEGALNGDAGSLNPVSLSPSFLVLMDVHYNGMTFVTPPGFEVHPWIAERLDSSYFETILLGQFRGLLRE